MALAFVVLLTLAIFALAHGVLVAALREYSASLAAVRLLESRSAAETGARLASRLPAGPWMDSVDLWEVYTIETVSLGRAEASGSRLQFA